MEPLVAGIPFSLASKIAKQLTDVNIPTAQEIINNAVDAKGARGVYFLIQDNKIVYVGQSVNVFNRIACHTKDKRFDSYYFLPCPHGNLDVIESAYIHALNPLLNGECGDYQKHAPSTKLDLIKDYLLASTITREWINILRVFFTLDRRIDVVKNAIARQSFYHKWD